MAPVHPAEAPYTQQLGAQLLRPPGGGGGTAPAAGALTLTA